MPDDGMPQRRKDDCVSYKEMVEYVTQAEVQWHTVRAESLIQIGNAVEKMEKAFDDHEKWHRDVLEKMVAQNSTMIAQHAQNRLAIYALILTAIGILVATLVTLFHH